MERISALLPRLLALSLVLVAGIATPAAATNVGETIILRCTHGQSLSGFSRQAYSEALKELTADAREYTECGSLIRQAQLAAATGRGVSGAPVVPIPPTSSEQRAIAHATHARPIPVRIGGTLVHPGVVHANIGSAFSSLPTPLLATVIFLLACLLLVGGGAVRKRFRDSHLD
ncbi:MAG TPA: hypothetical protein VGO14_11550 [Solirubrobacteraceae bacterium]|nr:hypothetical protein [Solirubrobacteraceae bacterium]